MILKGSQRSGARQLALHLLNRQDNDKVEVHAIKGFVADDVEGAFTEIHAIARATQCRQFMFSLSLSPPKGTDVPVTAYEIAIEQAAKRLGLQGQPHVVIFHEKAGRRHAHAVFSRIDAATMTAINLPFFKERLNALAHELYLTHGWELPEGFRDRQLSDPLSYSLEEYQTAKRAKADPKNIKARLLGCWEQSDSAPSFVSALREEGFLLCRGDRRGFVLLDREGNIYSLSRWLGEKPRTLRERLGEPEIWPNIEEQKAALEALPAAAQPDDPNTKASAENKDLATLRRHLARLDERHLAELEALQRQYAQRDLDKAGLKGLWQHLVAGPGKRAQSKRHEAALQTLATRQAAERKVLEARTTKLEKTSKKRSVLSNSFASQSLPSSKDELRAFRQLAIRIRQTPEEVLDVVTEQKAVFTRSDIARALHRFIDDPAEFQHALIKACTSEQLVALSSEAGAKKQRFSTRTMITLERDMVENVKAMAANTIHAVHEQRITGALSAQDKSLCKAFGGFLSDEQREAVNHVTGSAQICTVTGLAGAGKSTMLSAAREAWERQGYHVLGAALAGKAADGLHSAAGISSRTLASFEKSWEHGLSELGPKDVLVIDEAGMIGTSQLARFVSACKKTGAKLVLVGDPQQLQPIGAGAPFRAIADAIGTVRLDTVRRQKLDWQQEASRNFAEGRQEQALAAYDAHGAISFADDTELARAELVQAYLDNREEHGSASSRLALAHSRKDVRLLNAQIRAGLKDMGALGKESTINTSDGKRTFAAGDRLIFLQNDRDLGVKNGLMGTVQDIAPGKLTVRLDQEGSETKPKIITIPLRGYDAIDHGYATTIHKSQGATVDRSFVLASKSLDRHLSYVAMTRHKTNVRLFAGRDSFADLQSLTRTFTRQHAKENALEYEALPKAIHEAGGLQHGSDQPHRNCLEQQEQVHEHQLEL